ncbi:MAG: sulfatase-like hydrolase/transferase [Thermomicrobiales bacterium]|nr:sulfatase-like hydrolase/transferase [Thermomicrobiales bacterium]
MTSESGSEGRGRARRASAPPILSRRTTRRHAIAAAGLATVTPLAGLLARQGLVAAQEATPGTVAATPPYVPPVQTEQVVLPQPDFRFPGTVGATSATSDPPQFPQPVAPPPGAPNVLLVLVDDAGFGQFGTFGGATPTPTADRLASEGLRYNRFHTTALCSPTRAALMTGRNHHPAATGVIGEIATGYDGYTSIIPRSTGTVAQTLQLNGYSTAWFGKNHNVPAWEHGPAGPFAHWPTGMGFDYFYGFVDGEADQWQPMLWEQTTPIMPYLDDPDYTLNQDLADKAITWIDNVTTFAPDKPFFCYYCPGATHAPHHVPAEWSDKFKGQFDGGWDQYREETFARQKQLGVIPPDAQLTPRPAEIPAWDSFSPQQQQMFARQMEVFAGFTAQVDYEVGRVIDFVRGLPNGENTLIFYILGDNGASAEGGLTGTINEMTFFNGVPADDAYGEAHLAEWGDATTYPHFTVGWAWAMNTPFQWTKQIASHFGGTRNPMIVSWPERITGNGEVCSQFHHVIDIAPTILEAAGIAQPTIVNGIAQKPIEGTSMVYTFDDVAAPDRRTQQYFEIMVNRGIYDRGWTAVSRAILPWQATDAAVTDAFDPFNASWELYNIDKDFSQANDLAAQEPEKLRELQDLLWGLFAKYDVLPLQWNNTERLAGVGPFARPTYNPNSSVTYSPGMIRIAPSVAPRTFNRSFRITAVADIPDGGATGGLVALGGVEGGWSFTLQDPGALVFHYNWLITRQYRIASTSPVPVGDNVTLVADFAYDGGGFGKGATVTLSANGQQIGQGRIDMTVPLMYGTDGFDIGGDYGGAVSPDYADKMPFVFSGTLESVTIDLL